MDTKIENGDFAIDSSGHLMEIYGANEAAQSLEICLKVPKGAFVYDSTLGSRLAKMKDAPEDVLRREILEAVERVTVAELDSLTVDDSGVCAVFVIDGEEFEISCDFEEE